MSSSDLTVVVMTRDRVDLLEKALVSVFDRQSSLPPVIVSDNSTREYSELKEFQQRYGFSYIRQPGTLTATEHHNACLQLPQTRWVWLLHDDDELRSGAVRGIEKFLEETHDAGIVVGGVQDITQDGEVTRHWVPRQMNTLRGDEGLLEVGNEWKVRAPCQIFRKQESLESGGFQDSAGYPSDVAFACKLAHDYGVRFYPEVIGLSRMGTHQLSHVKTEKQTQRWVFFHCKQVELIRSLGADTHVVNRLADFLIWKTYANYLSELDSVEHTPIFLHRLKNLCLNYAPHAGYWRQRVQNKFPLLFWGFGWMPGWINWPLYRLFRKARYLFGLLHGSNKS
jgi:hypothetical protein